MAIRVKARQAGAEAGKGGTAQGGGNAAVPGEVPEAGGLAAAAAGAREQAD